ncbi:MAG TPA: type VI secretion system ATPase TssH [Chthoniobacteraceae bacterium]|jgi:type VI secretion system protein VasG|nr:type VI secretion system ATPase TssH [Chthoniobacteraceae bacterium]
MAELRSGDLIGRLNALSQETLGSASSMCQLRGHRKLMVLHFLHQLAHVQDSDLHRIAQHFAVDTFALSKQLTASLDELRAGGGEFQGISQEMRDALEQSWVVASLYYVQGRVRTGHFLLGLLRDPERRSHLYGLANEFRKLKVDPLGDNFAAIVAGSPEDQAAPMPSFEAIGEAAAGGGAEDQPALNQYAVDLTERARQEKIDPVIGRDAEIRQLIDILMRRRQNNPILTGEAGVGKTAIVEGFALRIAAQDVPPALRNVSLRSLDLGLLQAGASVKGEFEKRLKQVIDEVQASPQPIILFIDEAHTLIGAGGAAGQNDAANLLKPALARGTLRTIAATTWAEYKRYFEKDAALTRRFQVIKVEEPEVERAVQMIRGLAPTLEKHHGVPVLDAALAAAARFSSRYIPSRQLPDKAVSLIDTACARVAVSQHATPAALEDSTRTLELLKIEGEILERESAIGRDHEKRRAEIRESSQSEHTRLDALTARWEQEKTLVGQLLAARLLLQKPDPADPGDPVAQLAECRRLEQELATVQGDSPLIFPHVDEQAVAAVIADWTGIPVGRMLKDEIQQTLHLADTLERRVIGQRHALDAIARRLQTNRARLDNPNRPIGVFMLVGPSGTGKTETALTLAETLFGDENSLIAINMSEFQEAHTVSTLKGAPPGYVGYGEGGKLTEAVRRRPYAVILLDEVEKAHPDVHELFFQVFDKGWMEDGEGRHIDFKNTVILLTSNAAQETIITLCAEPDLIPEPEALEKAMRAPLTKIFPDALLNRLVVIPYYPISQEMLRTIITLNLRKVERRIRESHGIPFTWDRGAVDLVAARCTELERGARLVDALITNTILPEIGKEILTRLSDGRPIEKIELTAAQGEFLTVVFPTAGVGE